MDADVMQCPDQAAHDLIAVVSGRCRVHLPDLEHCLVVLSEDSPRVCNWLDDRIGKISCFALGCASQAKTDFHLLRPVAPA